MPMGSDGEKADECFGEKRINNYSNERSTVITNAQNSREGHLPPPLSFPFLRPPSPLPVGTRGSIIAELWDRTCTTQWTLRGAMITISSPCALSFSWHHVTSKHSKLGQTDLVFGWWSELMSRSVRVQDYKWLWFVWYSWLTHGHTQTDRQLSTGFILLAQPADANKFRWKTQFLVCCLIGAILD